MNYAPPAHTTAPHAPIRARVSPVTAPEMLPLIVHAWLGSTTMVPPEPASPASHNA